MPEAVESFRSNQFHPLAAKTSDQSVSVTLTETTVIGNGCAYQPTAGEPRNFSAWVAAGRSGAATGGAASRLGTQPPTLPATFMAKSAPREEPLVA